MKKLVLGMAAFGMAAFAVSCAGNQKSANVPSLEGKWNIVKVDGAAIGEVETEPYLEFDTVKKQFHGNAGCNIINGDYKQNNSSLKFGETMRTMMMCADMATEDKIVEAISKVQEFKAGADSSIILTDKAGKELLELKR